MTIQYQKQKEWSSLTCEIETEKERTISSRRKLSTTDGVGSMCVRGPATWDSSSFLCIVWTLLPDEFIFLMKIDT